ncbi:hypothetical protein K501DRAFT_7952 [Backusella circina FSU 941]|nr:hypothetical protein K501DRAFT_7952 [Backusella circina FSU 941]
MSFIPELEIYNCDFIFSKLSIAHTVNYVGGMDSLLFASPYEEVIIVLPCIHARLKPVLWKPLLEEDPVRM